MAWATHGSNDAEGNLVTACSCCQYAKNYYPLDLLGWEIAPMSDPSATWDGLKGMEAELRQLIQEIP